MNESRKPCILIDEAARDQYLEAGYNTPEEANRDYAEEWHEVFSAVRRYLESRWRSGYGGEVDFFMEADPLPTRFIFIEISQEPMLCPELLAMVQDTLRGFDVDYAVCMRTDYTYMETEDGESYPLFDIFVEKTRILVYTEDKRVLELLGVEPVAE